MVGGEGTRVMHRLLSSAPSAPLPPAHQLHIIPPFAVIIYQIISIHRFLALSPGNKTSSCSEPRQPRWMVVMVVVGAMRRAGQHQAGGEEEEERPMLFHFPISSLIGINSNDLV